MTGDEGAGPVPNRAPAPSFSGAIGQGRSTCTDPAVADAFLAENREVLDDVEAAVPPEPFTSSNPELHEAPAHWRPEPEVLRPPVPGAKVAVEGIPSYVRREFHLPFVSSFPRCVT